MSSNLRRHFLKFVGTIPLACVFSRATAWAEINTQVKEVTVEEWMDEWMRASRAPMGALHLLRFVEPVYVTTKSIAWKPNAGQMQFAPVEVPWGFVTDFASIL
jgi:hypothetical protein